MPEQRPTIGRVVHYVNLGDKDGKYPPEIQAAVITGVYRKADNPDTIEPAQAGNNEPSKVGVAPANALGQIVDSNYVDLKVFYRSGFFDMKCVPFGAEPTRGHWTWPPRV